MATCQRCLELTRERDELLEQAGDLNHVLSKHVKRAGELGRQVATLTEALRDLKNEVEKADHWLKHTDAFEAARAALAKAGVE